MVSAGDSLALLGRTIGGHFRIEEVIGEGRHSIVYRAKHEGPDEPVAIRVLKLGLSDDPASVDAFVRKWRIESSAVSGVVLGDPQLVRTIEFGTAATGVGSFAPFSASEWLEGRSLSAEIAKRGPMAIKDVVLLLDPPVTALAYAHRSGVPHGSLTPRSLFLAATADGPQLRVLDLGMWIALAEVTRNQPAGSSLFVSPWAAPEHLDPSIGDVGLATDVHSLARIVAEMMLGKTILAPDADEDEIRRVVLRPACTPKDLGLSLAGHVERVIARALLRDPSERWPDVGVFWGALRGAIADDEAGVPLASWNTDEADTGRRYAMSEPTDDELTPTGLTPTGLTPTGPTGTDLTPTGPASRQPDSGGGLPEFDENETTEMPPFAPTVEMPVLRAEDAFDVLTADEFASSASPSPASATSPAIAAPSSIVRPPDDEDLTPVRPTSSSKTRAAKVSRGRPGPLAMEVAQDIEVKPAPNGKGPPPSVRRPQKPGDPPPEVAGSGRATGLKVTVPAPAANIRVDDLPSVIVDDAMAPNAPSPSDNDYRRPPIAVRTPMDDRTVVQLEPPAEPFISPLSSPPPAQPISRAPPTPRSPHPGGRNRSMPPPAPARHYGASGRRARERRRQLFIVGAAVFAAVVVAMGILFAIRGLLVP